VLALSSVKANAQPFSGGTGLIVTAPGCLGGILAFHNGICQHEIMCSAWILHVWPLLCLTSSQSCSLSCRVPWVRSTATLASLTPWQVRISRTNVRSNSIYLCIIESSVWAMNHMLFRGRRPPLSAIKVWLCGEWSGQCIWLPLPAFTCSGLVALMRKNGAEVIFSSSLSRVSNMAHGRIFFSASSKEFCCSCAQWWWHRWANSVVSAIKISLICGPRQNRRELWAKKHAVVKHVSS